MNESRVKHRNVVLVILIKELCFMATSSITRNFVIAGKRQVETFADAIEASANDRPVRMPVAAKQLKGKADLLFLKEKREKAKKEQIDLCL